jgi:hypothetical protein
MRVDAGDLRPLIAEGRGVCSGCLRPSSRRASIEHGLSEGLPVPREPAYAAERSQDGEAKAAFE